MGFFFAAKIFKILMKKIRTQGMKDRNRKFVTNEKTNKQKNKGK